MRWQMGDGFPLFATATIRIDFAVDAVAEESLEHCSER